MKKTFLFSMFVLSIFALSSCSSSGSKDLVLNDVRIDYGSDKDNDNSIEVIPDTYTLTWDCDNYGTNDDFYVGKIKIKIKTTKQLVYNGDRKDIGLSLIPLDANGKEIYMPLSPREKDYDFSSGDITDYDAINAAIDALISPVGTVSEISFSTATYPGDVVKKFKKIENIKVEFNDHKFKVIK